MDYYKGFRPWLGSAQPRARLDALCNPCKDRPLSDGLFGVAVSMFFNICLPFLRMKFPICLIVAWSYIFSGNGLLRCSAVDVGF